jgi:hypothetical protein
LVTDASNGVGRGIAIGLAEAGYADQFQSMFDDLTATARSYEIVHLTVNGSC